MKIKHSKATLFYYGQSLETANTVIQMYYLICYIQCIGFPSCMVSNIVSFDVKLEQLIIVCNGNHSCYDLSVNISNTNLDIIDIECTGFEATSSAIVQIHCDGARACHSMDIKTIHTSINAN